MRIVALFLVLGAATAEGAPTEAKSGAGQPPALDLPALLADPAGVVRGRDRLERMGEVLAAARTPLEQASVELAMANWLLAVPTASPATRWLVGLPQRDDLERIHESARDAQEHLARARKLLGPDEAEPKERWRELRSAASVLEAFAKVMFSCADQDDSPTYRDGCESAAVGLGSARESEKQPIAAAAMMWQAQAFALARRTERTLSILPEALARPDRLPYDFMSRVLRCRVLAETGEPAAAIALAMRMGAICDDWFPQQDQEAVQARRRLVGIVQARVTRDWLARLAASPEAAEPLARTLDPLQKSLFPEGKTNPVYHLETALPILIEAPPLRIEEPAAPRDGARRDGDSAPTRPSRAISESAPE